jgi:hypothetical protein
MLVLRVSWGGGLDRRGIAGQKGLKEDSDSSLWSANEVEKSLGDGQSRRADQDEIEIKA